MRRFVALLVCICVVFGMVTATAYEDAPSSGYGDAIDMVTAFGFMTGYNDNEFGADLFIKRGEAAQILSALSNTGVRETDVKAASSFADVSETYWAVNYINAVCAQSLMNGYSDGLFYPENRLSFQEAVKVIVQITGSESLAKQKGDYPTGYMLQAAESGLLKSIDAAGSDYITKGMMAQLILNASEVEYMRLTGVAGGFEYGMYETQRGFTFLSHYHGVYKSRGVVTANKFTAINRKYRTKSGITEIDNVLFADKKDICAPLLGQRVEYYYYDSADTDTKEIRYARGFRNEILIIGDEQLSGLELPSSIQYTQGKHSVSASIAQNTNIIYNNMYHGKAINVSESDMLTDSGGLKLIDNNGDGIYDVCFITRYKPYVISSVNVEEKQIFMKYDMGIIAFDTGNVAYEILRDGKQIDISLLRAGSLVSVAASLGFDSPGADGSIQVVLCTEVLSAEVGAVASLDNEVTLITANNRLLSEISLKVSPYFLSDGGVRLTPGGRGSFYVDAAGKIAYYIPVGAGGKKFGFVVDSAISSGLSKLLQIKMLSADSGGIEIFKTDNTIVVDGIKQTPEQLRQIFLDNTLVAGKGQLLVRYALNADGLVNFIDTNRPDAASVERDVNTLTEYTMISSRLRYQVLSTMLVGVGNTERILLGPSTRVFIIPEEAESDDDYRIYNSTFFVNAEYYGAGAKMSMYNVINLSPQAVVFVQPGSGTSAPSIGSIDLSQARLGIVKGRSRVMDENGDERAAFKIETSLGEQTLYLKEKSALLWYDKTQTLQNDTNVSVPGIQPMSPDDFGFGDLVIFEADPQYKATRVIKLNPYHIWELSQTESPTYYACGLGGYSEWGFGSAREISGDYLAVDVLGARDLYVKIGAAAIYVVDVKAKTVTKTTKETIMASEVDTMADKVFVRNRFGEMKDIVIYR